MPQAMPMPGATDFTAEGCTVLPAVRAVEDGTPIVVSKWRFTRPELDELMRTGFLFISVVGTNPQPIRVTIDNPLPPSPPEAAS